MAMSVKQKEDRLALIKKIAEEKNLTGNLFKSRRKVYASKLMRYVDGVESSRRELAATEADEKLNSLDENYNQWADAPSYAKKYYGEVAKETTKFDNQWD